MKKTVRLVEWGIPKSPIMLPIHVFMWNNSFGLIESIDWRLMTKHTEEKHKRFRFLLNGRRGHWSSLNIHSYEHKGRLSLCFLFNQQTWHVSAPRWASRPFNVFSFAKQTVLRNYQLILRDRVDWSQAKRGLKHCLHKEWSLILLFFIAFIFASGKLLLPLSSTL